MSARVFYSRIQAILLSQDRDMAWLSRETGIATSTLGELKAGRLPRADRALKIAQALETTVESLFSVYGETTVSASGAIAPMLARLHAKTAVADDLDLVTVSEIDLTFGLGGTFSEGPVETQVLHFGRSWLESITHSPPSMLTFARGRGDSMQPTIQDGDIVLIDRSISTPREQDAIWALTIGDFAMIKRLRMRGDTVTILSDNDRVPVDEAHHEEINIVGRVIFIGRRL